MKKTPRHLKASLFLLSTLVAAFFAAPAVAGATTVLVQGTTDIRDAGLLEEVIEPGFHQAYPQYDMKYTAVGTGQAIANAKAGQGDALVVHAPTQEKTFVEEGYSLEPRGRAIFYSDYVIPGPLDDATRANVLGLAPHNAVKAFQLIAKAGEEGKATFVSRGDKSGTNTQELLIWKLASEQPGSEVKVNSAGEPLKTGTTEVAPWYKKGGGGQAETVLLAQQCPFPNGGCYEMTDRGTFNRLINNGSVKALQIVTQNNESSAPGGQNLLTNPFVVYVINPAKVPGVNINVEGAKALVAYLTSEAFQARLASFPNTSQPAFFADAHPQMSAGPGVSGTVKAGATISFSGSLKNLLPGSPTVAGVPIALQRLTAMTSTETPKYVTIATTTTDTSGNYTVGAVQTRSGALRVSMPTTLAYPNLAVTPLIAAGALTETNIAVGEQTVQSKIGIKGPKLKGRVVTLLGQAGPSLERDSGATFVVQGRKLGTRKKQKFHALKTVRPKAGAAYKINVKLKGKKGEGKWKLRVRYRDPTAVLPVTSRAVSVSVH